jgi:FixJ family two-component response regulator
MGADGGVIFLDDDHGLREAFANLLQVAFGRTCVPVGSYRDLIALGDHTHACPVAFLDINLGPECPSGIDAYRWLRARAYGGRIVFLTGHAASHPLVAEARRLGDARVVAKPMSFDMIASLLEEEAVKCSTL